MPVFVEMSSCKISFVFQKNDRALWLHYYALKGVPPHWPASRLNVIDLPKSSYLAFDSLSAYVQNPHRPPSEQILCWLRNHLPRIALTEKFTVEPWSQGALDYDGHPIPGCPACPHAVKIPPLHRFMCTHPLAGHSMRWGFADGRSTLVSILAQEGFPPWCVLPRISSEECKSHMQMCDVLPGTGAAPTTA